MKDEIKKVLLDENEIEAATGGGIYRPASPCSETRNDLLHREDDQDTFSTLEYHSGELILTPLDQNPKYKKKSSRPLEKNPGSAPVV